MEDKGKKAARRTADVTWDKSAVKDRKALRPASIDHLALPGTIHLVPMDLSLIHI